MFWKNGDLRLWYIPQVPGEAFRVCVKNVADAIRIADILAEYDLFLFKNKINPNCYNAQGLEIYENGEWREYYDKSL